jgi:hypothetical protein
MTSIPEPGNWSRLRNAVRATSTMPLFVAQHLVRTTRIERCYVEVDEVSEAPPPSRPHDGAQSRDEGVGPLVIRTYQVDIDRPTRTARELIEEFRIDPNQFISGLAAGFVNRDRPARNLEAGDQFVVELPGPWNGPVHVDHSDDEFVILATLQGHMEAGHIRFDVAPFAGGYSFRIRSWARAGDRAFAALHLAIPIARELQTAVWTAMCDRAVTISGGTRAGKIRVATEELVKSMDAAPR